MAQKSKGKGTEARAPRGSTKNQEPIDVRQFFIKKVEKGPAAYFLSLELENVRCFKEKQKLDLSNKDGRHATWTVILGENGVGKTTLLQCLAAFDPLGYETDSGEKIALPNFSEFHLLFDWNFLRSKLPYYVDQNPSDAIASFNCQYSVEGEVCRIDCDVDTYAVPKVFDWFEFERIRAFRCYGYGASRRMRHFSSQGRTTTSGNSFEVNPAAGLFRDIELPNAEEWLLQTDYAASKVSAFQEQTRHRLDEIKKILVQILPGVEDIKFSTPSSSYELPGVLFQTPDGWVSIWDLSHGYQTLIAWVVDFARRMFERYPESKNPLAEPAVVLVDEIDLHLHPTWQRSLMGYLTERFPNTQFIVTAHSPLIVQGAKDVNVVLLRREGDHVVIENRDSESIRNWRVDQILTSDLFGLESVRPPYVEEKLAERRKLLSKAKLTKKEQARVKELEAEIGPLPTGDTPQEIKAMDIINRAAKLLSERSGGK